MPRGGLEGESGEVGEDDDEGPPSSGTVEGRRGESEVSNVKA